MVTWDLPALCEEAVGLSEQRVGSVRSAKETAQNGTAADGSEAGEGSREETARVGRDEKRLRCVEVRGESEPELETTNRKARAHDASTRVNAASTRAQRIIQN